MKLIFEDLADGDETERLVFFLMDYGGIDGEHHKQWALDQILRKLTGDRYTEIVTLYEQGGLFEWDVGIAP